MNKQTYWLIGLLIFIVIIFIIIQSSQPELEESASSTFTKFDTLGITRIQIDAPNDENDITLQKVESTWQIVEPIQYPADERKIQLALGSLAKIPPNPDVISENPKKQNKFQVDSTGTNLTIYKDDEIVADLITGKSDKMRAHTFVREENSDKVVSIPGNLSYFIGQPLNQWRDKSIVNIPFEEFYKIEYQNKDIEININREDTAWQVTKNREEISPDEAKIEGLLQLFNPLRARGFAEEVTDLNWNNSDTELRLITKDNSTFNIKFIEKDNNSYYAKLDERATIFIVSKYLIDRLSFD